MYIGSGATMGEDRIENGRGEDRIENGTEREKRKDPILIGQIPPPYYNSDLRWLTLVTIHPPAGLSFTPWIQDV